MDNRIFNVNGTGRDMLEKALKLALIQSGNRGFASWIVDPKKGLLLCWTDVEGANNFITNLSAAQVVDQVAVWLTTDEAKRIPKGDMCDNADHDGDNEMGWQVYCESWGHVGGNRYAICAVRPAYLWYGK